MIAFFILATPFLKKEKPPHIPGGLIDFPVVVPTL
jgi:hypothetical protein